MGASIWKQSERLANWPLQCKLGDGEVYTSIKNALDARNGGRHANIRDALIAGVAITNGYGLVTADTDLADVARDHGGEVIHVAV